MDYGDFKDEFKRASKWKGLPCGLRVHLEIGSYCLYSNAFKDCKGTCIVP